MPDELLQIQRILVGGLASRTDDRFAALEASLAASIEGLESRMAARLDALDERVGRKADRAEIAEALEGIARSLRAPAPRGKG